MTGERRTTAHLENKNSEDIVELRREYKTDISGIHERIDQIFDVLRRNKPSDYKAVLTLGISLFVTVIFSLGAILQIQIAASQEYQNKIQAYSDMKNDSEHQHLKEYVKVEADEIRRIRTWKDDMESTIPKIEKDISWLIKYIDTKSTDRFTGKEGNLLKERIQRLEKSHP